MLACIILIGWLLMVWIYFLWSRRRYYKAAWQLRGPIGWPLIGMGLQMMNPETFLQYMDGLSRQFKAPFISWMGTNCFLYINDPHSVEQIFNSTHCTNKGDFYRFISSAIGDGLFTSSSPRWHKHRRLINPAFSRQILSNFLPIFNAEAQVLLEKLDIEGVQHGKRLEIYQILKKIVLEAACQTTMGRKMNFQHDGSMAIFEAYNGLTEVCVKRMLSPWLYPELLYRRSRLFRLQQKVVGILFGFIEQLLEPIVSVVAANANPEQQRPEQEMRGKSKAIFIEQVREHVERGQLSWQDVRDEANVTIAATFETTSTALYFTILCLAMHPCYQEKLYVELVRELPPTGDISLEQLQRLEYTEMVINEAMRLFAPVPMVLRSAEQDIHLKRDEEEFLIPRGTQIGIDIYNMQRDERVWGALSRTYNPEAHFGLDAPPRHAFAFVPFTKGLRMCIGYRYAQMLMKLLLARIFRSYRISTEARLEELLVKGNISLKLKDYPLCRVERR
ncbi:probable cytochrome P450 313b1 [Drosophila eugracilis]|uniref:probable cytochrome P450 313b1 n=1 Tax=Drosophila eugracilis TaxID=29029 RepID=UPI0007E787D1|nr:probable cytochrome P450 313b1 [Drosophila eugracilis]XP_017073418.1 probable cytochrome P450 313b1 [Drosophila eugracilis]